MNTRHIQSSAFETAEAAPILAVDVSSFTRGVLFASVDWVVTYVAPLLWRVIAGNSLNQLVTLVAGPSLSNDLFGTLRADT